MSDTEDTQILQFIEDFTNRLNETDREFFQRLPLDLKQREELIRKIIAYTPTDEEE